MKILTLLLITFFLVSCGHGQLFFESYPDKVDVSVIENDGQIKNLGTTPLKVDIDSIFNTNGAVKILFSKNGYREESVYVTKPAIRSDIKLSTRMQQGNSANEIISNQKIERISHQIAEAQRYNFNKNYKRAEEILLKVIDNYPDVSVPYDLLANVYYLSNNRTKALHFYGKANGLAPGNRQRDNLMNKLRRETNNPGEN